MKIFARQHVTCAKVITTEKITGDYLSPAKEEAIVTMAHFMPAHRDSYWDVHCNIIVKSNELIGYSVFIVHQMIPICYSTHEDLKRISNNCTNEEIF